MPRRLLILLAACIAVATPAHAQYMYMDSNGDGIANAADGLLQGANIVDVWLATNQRADGSAAVCSVEPSPLTINSYQVVLRASASVAMGTWTNRMPFTIDVGNGQAGTDKWVGWASGTSLPPGTYRLGTLSVTVAGATPALSIVASTPHSVFAWTAFGSQCSGVDFDNTLKLGTDWFDVRGLETPCVPTNPNNAAPSWDAPAEATALEGQAINLTATATDPDADPLVITTMGKPASLTLSTSGTSPVTASLQGTLGFNEAGTYSIQWIAFDTNCASATATTTLTVGNVDRPIVITAPASRTVAEGSFLIFGVSASDPEGDPIAYLQASGMPPGATFSVNTSHTFGNFSWTPTFTQSGHYVVTFAAGGTTEVTATTEIDVTNSDLGPEVVGPSVLGGFENQLITYTVTASDPDGDAITSLTANGLPSGSSFVANATNTSGTFTWTPTFSQAGSYQIDVLARNDRLGIRSTLIQVENVDRPPVVSAPAAYISQEGALMQFPVSASDPDNESFTLTAGGLPLGASFTPSAGGGTFSWTPSFTQTGTYDVTFTATNALSASAHTVITVGDVNRAPVITAPNALFTSEGTPISFNVSAVDPDGDPVLLGMLARPVGATFVDLGGGNGSFSWTPSFTQAGTYMPAVTARDALGNAAPLHVIMITVDDVNRAPIASAGGPYTGVVNQAIEFDGTGSSDPDGEVLSYSWSFGDGATGMGSIASHTYSAGGTFVVTLTVTDGTSAAVATTSARVQDVFTARVFTVSPNGTIRLASGKATWCVQTEPVDGAYQITAVDASSITLSHDGRQIHALADKSSLGGDKDGNGIAEMAVCFGKTDLRTLFEGLPRGTSMVTVTVEGALVTGGRFRGTTNVEVVNGGGALAASVSPNPLNPSGVLTFRTEREGTVSAVLYDAQGRMVRSLLERTWVAPGYHDVRIDGFGKNGAPLATGVYFYRISSPDGPIQGRFTVLK